MVNGPAGEDQNPQITEDSTASLTPGELDRMRRYIAQPEWVFAKTMPQVPHWYTVRGRRPDLDDEFIWFVAGIRERGYKMRWGKYNHTYLNIDGWRYWTMGASFETTIILNREKINA